MVLALERAFVRVRALNSIAIIVLTLSATFSLVACSDFLYSDAGVNKVELETLIVQWVRPDSTVLVADSTLTQIRVLNGDGADVTSLVDDVHWRLSPTSIAALSHGLDLGPSGRFVHGLTPGLAIVLVQAVGQDKNGKEVMSAEEARTFVVEPQP